MRGSHGRDTKEVGSYDVYQYGTDRSGLSLYSAAGKILRRELLDRANAELLEEDRLKTKL